MFKWYRRLKRKLRIENGYCGYCPSELVWINLFDGKSWIPTKVCPFLHCGTMYYTSYKDDKLNSIIYKPIINKEHPGHEMIIPDEWMKVMVVKLDANDT